MRCELAAEFAGQIGHGVERIGATLVHPALQLTGAKRLAAPLPDKFGQGGAIQPQQIDSFDGFHDLGNAKKLKQCFRENQRLWMLISGKKKAISTAAVSGASEP